MAETISAKQAREQVASRELVVVDVREQEAWSERPEGIPGSLHIPAAEIESRIDELPDEGRVLVVSPDGSGAAEVAEQLEQAGRDAASLEGGVDAWRSERLFTQPSPDADPPKEDDEEPVEEPRDDETGEPAADASSAP